MPEKIEQTGGGGRGRRLQITVPTEVAERWEKAARDAGVSLSSWVAMQVKLTETALGRLDAFMKVAMVDLRTIGTRLDDIE